MPAHNQFERHMLAFT